jgi:hypothetical protein
MTIIRKGLVAGCDQYPILVLATIAQQADFCVFDLHDIPRAGNAADAPEITLMVAGRSHLNTNAQAASTIADRH